MCVGVRVRNDDTTTYSSICLCCFLLVLNVQMVNHWTNCSMTHKLCYIAGTAHFILLKYLYLLLSILPVTSDQVMSDSRRWTLGADLSFLPYKSVQIFTDSCCMCPIQKIWTYKNNTEQDQFTIHLLYKKYFILWMNTDVLIEYLSTHAHPYQTRLFYTHVFFGNLLSVCRSITCWIYCLLTDKHNSSCCRVRCIILMHHLNL